MSPNTARLTAAAPPTNITTNPALQAPRGLITGSGFVRPPPTPPASPRRREPLRPSTSHVPTLLGTRGDGRGPYCPARLPLAQDERIREAPAAGKRDRAGLPAVRPRSQTAGSFLDCPPSPGSSRSLRPAAPAGQAPPTSRAASAPPCPARASLPPSPPASDSDGLGLGLPAATREPGPAGPVRSVGPREPPTRVQACRRTFMIDLGQRGSRPFRKVSANRVMGCSLCYLRWGLVALSDSLLPSLVSSLQSQ
ncbi:hypothetical protein LEMLEM_LOCUS5782 [Lemmus lemmus]